MAFCYINGEFLEEENAHIPIHTLGIQRGFGIFDFFRSRNAIPTFIDDYLERFDRSQKFLNLNRNIEKEEVLEAIAELEKRNRFGNSAFKLMLLGDGKDTDELLHPFFYIVNIPESTEPQPESGILLSREYIREYPEIKTVNYLTSYHLHERKRKTGAVDVLYYKNNIISETSRSNVFMIKDGILLTPEHNILHGINRKHILKMNEQPLKIRICDISLDELLAADEVFISSTLKQIMPIVRIEDHQIGNGKPGEQTLKLRQHYHDYLMSHL
ncbi:MAG: aminotransferase class IV [Cyclobacteriaceae bacterium]